MCPLSYVFHMPMFESPKQLRAAGMITDISDSSADEVTMDGETAVCETFFGSGTNFHQCRTEINAAGQVVSAQIIFEFEDDVGLTIATADLPRRERERKIQSRFEDGVPSAYAISNVSLYDDGEYLTFKASLDEQATPMDADTYADMLRDLLGSVGVEGFY